MKLPQFHSCHKKQEARQNTIIDRYREYFTQKLPKTSQYWTMCASQTDENGNFKSGSELGQMLSTELITEEQFYGVDINKDIIALNKQSKPNSNWFCNDFVDTMKRYDEFHPGIVNADLLSCRKKAYKKAAEILSFLTDGESEQTLLVCNWMLTNPHSHRTRGVEYIEQEFDRFIPDLEQENSFKYAWRSGKWKMHPVGYIYNGSGSKSNTYLASFIFMKDLN